MTSANTAGAAYSASVETEEVSDGLLNVKNRSIVEYFERELQKADEAIERLTAKVEKQQERLEDAQQALTEKQEERDQLAAELESAQGEVE